MGMYDEINSTGKDFPIMLITMFLETLQKCKEKGMSLDEIIDGLNKSLEVINGNV